MQRGEWCREGLKGCKFPELCTAALPEVSSGLMSGGIFLAGRSVAAESGSLTLRCVCVWCSIGWWQSSAGSVLVFQSLTQGCPRPIPLCTSKEQRSVDQCSQSLLPFISCPPMLQSFAISSPVLSAVSYTFGNCFLSVFSVSLLQ